MITLIFAEHTRGHPVPLQGARWYRKRGPALSDAIATVRRLFWAETIFHTSPHHDAFEKLPRPLRRILLDHLSLAA
ncbi:MAG: hypothetical protein ACOC95_06860 [Planctomycetota bacterium]